MARDAPLTAEAPEAQLLAPLWQPQPTVSSKQRNNKVKHHARTHHLEYDCDISSLALVFVPSPFTSGGGTAYTMDSPGARRFSASTAERVGLLKAHDRNAKQNSYGAISDPSEIEGLLGADGTTEELGTTAAQEAKLLLKYSLPLMGTYLLQYSFSLVTIFVVGHSKLLR